MIAWRRLSPDRAKNIVAIDLRPVEETSGIILSMDMARKDPWLQSLARLEKEPV
jgi:hypothetical protein